MDPWEVLKVGKVYIFNLYSRQPHFHFLDNLFTETETETR